MAVHIFLRSIFDVQRSRASETGMDQYWLGCERIWFNIQLIINGFLCHSSNYFSLKVCSKIWYYSLLSYPLFHLIEIALNLFVGVQNLLFFPPKFFLPAPPPLRYSWHCNFKCTSLVTLKLPLPNCYFTMELSTKTSSSLSSFKLY